MTDRQAKLMWLHRPKRRPAFHGPWPKFWSMLLLLLLSLTTEVSAVTLDSKLMGAGSAFGGFVAMAALRQWCFEVSYTVEKS